MRHLEKTFYRFKQSIPIALIAVLFLLLTAAFPLPAQETLSDSKITHAIEANLVIDDIISTEGIDVETMNGIVTLSGWVNHLLAKDRAEEISETIKGVRSVINTISVKPAVKTDAEIRQQVETALAVDPAAESFDIDVSVNAAVVKLSGKVQSWPERRICLDIAKRVQGVRDMDNNITVEYKNIRPDAEIETEIEASLRNDVWIDADLVKVTVDNSRVFLSGIVGSAAEKSRAFLNSWVTGVDSVDNSRLKVQWWMRDSLRRESKFTYKSDLDIQEAIEDALLYDPRIAAPYVDVFVYNGTVTLTGIVDNYRAKMSAEEDAINTIGIIRVKNHIKVRPSGAVEDSLIQKRVQNALLWNPIVERYDLIVTVRDGVVYLYGDVHSQLKKKNAEQAAAGIKGVVDVRSYLTVDIPLTPKMDMELKQDVKRNLLWNPYLFSENITVSVDNGVVTLSGIVDSFREQKLAEDEAYRANAEMVINLLNVRRANSFEGS